VEPELHELTPYEAFPETVRAAASAMLDDVGSQPTRLSTLLVAALDASPATAHLVALLVLHAFSPALESHLRVGDETPLLLAWSDGTPLPPDLRRRDDALGQVMDGVSSSADDASSFYGDDLLVVRLDVGAAVHLVKEVA